MPTVTEAVTSGTISYTANSYVTLAYADAFHATSLEGIWWSEQDQGMRERALISGTRAIEYLLRGQDEDKWDSVRTSARPRGQPLQFPRAQDMDSGTLQVPPDIKDGQCLLALFLLQQQEGAGSIVDGEDMARLGLRVSTMDGVFASRAWVMPRYWPQDVQELIYPFWKRQGETVEDYEDLVDRLALDEWITPTA